MIGLGVLPACTTIGGNLGLLLVYGDGVVGYLDCS